MTEQKQHKIELNDGYVIIVDFTVTPYSPATYESPEEVMDVEIDRVSYCKDQGIIQTEWLDAMPLLEAFPELNDKIYEIIYDTIK